MPRLVRREDRPLQSGLSLPISGSGWRGRQGAGELVAGGEVVQAPEAAPQGHGTGVAIVASGQKAAKLGNPEHRLVERWGCEGSGWLGKRA